MVRLMRLVRFQSFQRFQRLQRFGALVALVASASTLAADYDELSRTGDEAFAAGRLAEAQQAYEASVMLPGRGPWDPNLSRLVRTACEHSRLGAVRAAAGHDARGLLLRALVDSAGGDLAAARKSLEQAVGLITAADASSPSLAPALTFLAFLQRADGDEAGAKAADERAASLRQKPAREDPLDQALLLAASAAAKERNKKTAKTAPEAWAKAAAALAAEGGAGQGLGASALRHQAALLEKLGRGTAAKATMAKANATMKSVQEKAQASAEATGAGTPCCFSSPGVW